jgi:hypothetical protein
VQLEMEDRVEVMPFFLINLLPAVEFLGRDIPVEEVQVLL